MRIFFCRSHPDVPNFAPRIVKWFVHRINSGMMRRNCVFPFRWQIEILQQQKEEKKQINKPFVSKKSNFLNENFQWKPKKKTLAKPKFNFISRIIFDWLKFVNQWGFEWLQACGNHWNSPENAKKMKKNTKIFFYLRKLKIFLHQIN